MLLSHLIRKVLKAKKRLKLTNPQIKEHQLREFRELAKFAAQNSNFYKKIVTENNIDLEICVPEDFPILDKNTLLENWDDIVTDKQITKAKVEEFLSGSKDPGELFLNKYYVMHTSGSSGQVGYYIYSESEFAAGLSHSNRISGTIFLKKISYVGATKGHFAGATMVEATKKLFPIYSGTQMLDINDPFDQIIKALNEFQPNVLTGYSFALKKLAEAKNSGELDIHPQTIVSGGEPLFFEDKEYIQKAFGKEVSNNYASTEFLIMGVGKDSLKGLYLMEDTLYFETFSDHTLITNLFNKTLPLIRYKSNDILEKIEDSQSFYPFSKIENVVGRREMAPIFVNNLGQEDFISPILIVEIFVKGLSAFQVVLESNQSFHFKVQYEKNLSDSEKMICQEELRDKLQSILNQKKMTNVQFEIQEVDQLWVDPKTGKFKLILKNY